MAHFYIIITLKKKHFYDILEEKNSDVFKAV